MKQGLIEGKKARTYANKPKSKRSKAYDDFILQNIEFGRKIKVCDFCCGHGNTIKSLKDKVGEITGVDGSSEMITICKERLSGVKLVLSSVTCTKLKSSYFDYVILRNGLHHIKEKEKVMGEVYRILKPKGKLILIDKFHTNVFIYHLKEIFNLLFKFKTVYFNHFILSKEATLSLLDQFKTLKEKYIERKKRKTIQSFMYLLEKKRHYELK